jgi:hypothetical protein
MATEFNGVRQVPNLKYFTNSFLFTGGALAAGGAIGWAAGGSLEQG